MNEKILIVDDEVGLLKILGNVLRTWGYNVITAKNGIEALWKFKEENPDLVLSDQRMPGMKGTEALAKMKEMNEDVPVVLMTGLPDEIQEKDRRKAYSILAKPFNLDELKTVIKEALLL